MLAPRSSVYSKLRQDLFILREAFFWVRALVPELAAIGLDDEIALAAWLFVDDGIRVSGLDGGGQTGRRGEVVSDDAVFDRDVHRRTLGHAHGCFR